MLREADARDGRQRDDARPEDPASAHPGRDAGSRQHVLQHFNREKNLVAFSDLIVANISATPISRPVEHNFYANPVLQ